MKYNRIQVSYDADIPASVSAAWDLLTDWAGLLRWWPDTAPFVIEDCKLVGADGQLPRTREIHVASGVIAYETLLHQDDVAKRIYYDMQQNEILNVRNYRATTTIDEIGPNACRMFFSSFSDADQTVDAVRIKESFLGIYTTIAVGFNGYFKARQS